MGKCEKNTKRHFKATADLSLSEKHQVIEIGPDELVAYVQRAEKHTLPLIKEVRLDAGETQFLLAQYTQALITGNVPLDPENTMTMTNMVLTLWLAGFYAPSPKYPFTLE